MEICKSCGQKVKTIPTYNNRYVICEAEKEIFYTELGRCREGYKLHKCEGKNESSKQQNSN